jgi:hypothetical protein
MRKSLVFTGLLAVFVLALTASPVSAGSRALTVASGSFTIVGSTFGLPLGTNRSFAFTVSKSSQGAITGQVALVSFSGAKFHGQVSCFTREGNQAIVGGTITFFTGNTEFVGTPFAFAIQDDPDVATFVVFGVFDSSASPCEELLPSQGEPDLGSLLNDDGFPVTTGNIMIAPTS